MDIAGAKALKERLGRSGKAEAPTASASADVPVDAPPVYRWTGVSHPARETPPAEAEDDAAVRAASLFQRLVLSVR